MVFLLIGLQAATIITDVIESDIGLARTSAYALTVLATVMFIRPVFIIFAAWLGRVARWDSPPLPA